MGIEKKPAGEERIRVGREKGKRGGEGIRIEYNGVHA